MLPFKDIRDFLLFSYDVKLIKDDELALLFDMYSYIYIYIYTYMI